MGPTRVFLSYSHRDRALVDELRRAAEILRHRGLMQMWSDRELSPGSRWASVIDSRLEEAAVAIFAVSPDFLASGYCWNVELRRALELEAEHRMTVLPVLLRPCHFDRTPLASFQVLPSDTPVTKWQDRDEAWKAVVAGIEVALQASMTRVAAGPRILVEALGLRSVDRYIFGGHADIGRSTAADFCFPLSSNTLSKLHARVTFNADDHRFKIQDLNSLHGISVNSRRLDSAHYLDAGDALKLGPDLLLLAALQANPPLLALRHDGHGEAQSCCWLVPGGTVTTKTAPWHSVRLEAAGDGARLTLRPFNDGRETHLFLKPGEARNVSGTTWQANFT